MTRKFKGKYRVDTTRAKCWNYARNGIYFVTICTKNRQHFFGKIVQNKMILNPIGEIAQAFWREIPVHSSFVVLDAFVVMPNHIHGIVIINRQSVDTSVNATVDTTVDAPKLGASTGNEHKRKTNAKINWSPGALGVIINQYKRICTIHARKKFPILCGNHDFMIISFVTNVPSKTSDVILHITLKNGSVIVITKMGYGYNLPHNIVRQQRLTQTLLGWVVRYAQRFVRWSTFPTIGERKA